MNGTDRADFAATQPHGTRQRPLGGPSRPAAVAITPALGPLPAIYIQQPPAPGAMMRTLVRWVTGLRRQGVTK
jgi:hypothetical protein